MLETGKILQGTYQLQQELGRTAPGRQTWLAVNLNTKEQVIVKLLAFSPEMQWEEFKLFEREAQILQTLNHPYIPQYRDYFSIDKNADLGLPWFGIVQEYIPGSSLQELLDKGQRFTEKEVKKIAIAILEILIYLHELSPPVLHRDIKPSNLIMGADNNVYLVDFGAVQAQGSITGVTFTVVGTSGYSPLEQYWGRAVAASDLYALGATLIHLLTGISPGDLPQEDSQIKFTHLVNINSSFVSWIEQITEIAVEKRFPTAREALEKLKTGKMRSKSSLEVPAVRKIAKPTHSQIEITKKSPEQLEIYIPSLFQRKIPNKFISFLLICLSSIIVACLLLKFILTLEMFYSSLAVITLIMFFLLIVKHLFATTFICFDRNQSIDRFMIEQYFLKLKYQRMDSISNIYGVFLHNSRDSQETYQVKIHSQSKTYTLINPANKQESIWLAQEIQDWLYRR
ncbi:serine/threonine-protein kinase [Okeania sp. SIO2B3]|uniref:serine/threonine protein kinase n=1 Tax=Okeania sp. SIO2B3 TaxID=2607784 RepID=UPI0025D5BF5E|nr:serine/threonine-protein kinase [Okeania sp. SIO2B3]